VRRAGEWAQERNKEGILLRMDSRIRGAALVLAGVVTLLCAGMVAGVADGKKKHKGKDGKVTVISSQQHAILDSGSVIVRVKGGQNKRLVVEGSGAIRLTTIRLTKAKKVKPGKSKMSLPLSSSGKTTLGGRSVSGLRARFVKGKKGNNEGQEDPQEDAEARLLAATLFRAAKPGYG
jgi:hypothetical protein